MLNVAVIGRALVEVLQHPEYFPRWREALFTQHSSPVMMLVAAFLVFPKLALGLSGFETGVAVMPLDQGRRGDHRGRDRRAHPEHQEDARRSGAC